MGLYALATSYETNQLENKKQKKRGICLVNFTNKYTTCKNNIYQHTTHINVPNRTSYLPISETIPKDGDAVLDAAAAALAVASLSRLVANHSRMTIVDSSDLGSTVRRFDPTPNVLSSATTSSWEPIDVWLKRNERTNERTIDEMCLDSEKS